MWSNYHTHSVYCDGKSTLSQLVQNARILGMKSIGFASHGPLPFQCNWCMKPEKLQDYINEIELLKKSGELEVYAGLEVDFVPGEIGPLDFINRLDFTVGSVHFVDSFNQIRWEADNTFEQFTEGLEKIFDNNIQKAVGRYFDLMRQMLNDSPPTILGHMDRIKMHNSRRFFFDENSGWFKDEIVHTLEVAQKKDVIIEVNTRGLYQKKSREPYPGNFAIKKIGEMKLPVLLSSDAHHHKDLINLFPEMAQLLEQSGVEELVQLVDGKWTLLPLKIFGKESLSSHK